MAVPSPKDAERHAPAQDNQLVSGERPIGEHSPVARAQRNLSLGGTPKLIKCVVWVLAGLAAYAVAGYRLVPWLVQRQSITYIHEQYQRTLRIGRVRFDPFSLALEVEHLELPDVDAEPALRFEKLTVDFEPWASLWRRAWVLREITLHRPWLRARIRPNGVLNLSDFRPRERAHEEASELPALAIDALTLSEGGVEFHDLSEGQTFSETLSPVSFRLRQFRTTQAGGTFSFSARSDQGARLWWEGKFALAPVLSSHGKMAVADIEVTDLANYLAAALPVEVERGRASVSLRYRVELDKPARARVTIADLALDDLKLSARSHASDRVEIPSVKVHAAQLTWPEREIEIAGIQLADLHTRVVLEESGKLNLLRMAATGDSSPSKAAWKLKLDRFSLLHASAAVEDRRVEPALEFALASLDVRARTVTLDPTRAIPFDVDARIAHGGALAAHGSITPASTTAHVKFELRDLPVVIAQPYVRKWAALTVEDGRLGIAGSLARVVEGVPRNELAAQVTLRDLHTRDELSHREFFSAQELALVDVHYRERPDQLTIRQVALKKPYARAVLSSQQELNVSEILKGGTDAKKAAPRPPGEVAPPMAIEIDEVKVEAMRLSFSDFFIKPNFSLELHDVNGSMKALSSRPPSRAKLALKGTLGATAPVRISGQLQPFAYDADTDISLSWQNVPLPVFNPYSGRFAGYSIETGDLASWLTYKVQSGELDAQHRIRIDQLEWGKQTETQDRASVPVRLATALLRDRHGVINLDVPVKGNLKDPQFEVWPLVKQVLRNIAVKAVTSPFDFLGSLFAGAEKARFIDFAPGESTLAASDAAELRALAGALADRPTLAVHVPRGIDRAVDREAIVERTYRRGLAENIKRELWGSAKNSTYSSLDADDQIEVLEALYESLTGREAKLGELPEPSSELGFRERRRQRKQAEVAALERMTKSAVQVDDDALEALGVARAEAIEQALLETGQVESHRVLVSSQSGGHHERGKVRIELTIE